MTVTEIFRARLQEERKRRGWSQAELSRRVMALGHRLDKTAISKIEGGPRPRGVTLDDAVALAAALDVPLFALLLGERDEEVELAPELRVRAPFVACWLAGTMPLSQEDVDPYRDAGNLLTRSMSAEVALSRFVARRDLSDQERKMLDAASEMHQRSADDLEEGAARGAAIDQAAADMMLRLAQSHREKAAQLRARPEEEK